MAAHSPPRSRVPLPQSRRSRRLAPRVARPRPRRPAQPRPYDRTPRPLGLQRPKPLRPARYIENWKLVREPAEMAGSSWSRCVRSLPAHSRRNGG
ncbi:MAG: hypothetical protein GEU68_09355 [Actinobacteria bacterium]|nr:hypothetical protein [Actinomycetota bacterium]